SPVAFGYIGVPSIITSVGGTPLVPGSSFTVDVQDPGVGPLGNAVIRFTVNGLNVTPTPSQITTGTGVQTFTMNAPLIGFTFPTVACTTGGGGAGTQLGPITTTILFTNATTGCTASVDGVPVNPPSPNPCLTAPSGSTVPSGATCATPPNATVTAGAGHTTTTTITVSNAASAQPLIITGAAIGGANAADFIIAPLTGTIAAGASQTFTLSFTPTVVGAKVATVTFNSNSVPPMPPVCVTATAVP
ncbi:MAG: Ig-like domain-containing protein, partial [Thermoanaerobaculia bacterium]